MFKNFFLQALFSIVSGFNFRRSSYFSGEVFDLSRLTFVALDDELMGPTTNSDKYKNFNS